MREREKDKEREGEKEREREREREKMGYEKIRYKSLFFRVVDKQWHAFLHLPSPFYRVYAFTKIHDYMITQEQTEQRI